MAHHYPFIVVGKFITNTDAFSPLRNKRPSIFMDPSYQTSERYVTIRTVSDKLIVQECAPFRCNPYPSCQSLQLQMYNVFSSKRRRTPNSSEKGSKGLRHFAMLVCEKVKQKVTTTYNEVADELVAEYSDAQRLNLSDQVWHLFLFDCYLIPL